MHAIVKRFVSKGLSAASAPVRMTNWYKGLFVDPDHERYPDNVWYRAHDERNLDVVNLGSSSARWAFDWTVVPGRGMNWANQPQTLIDDARLFKNFHSILKKNGVVLIVIMPFTGLNKQTGVMDVFKYFGTLDWTLLDPAFRDQAARLNRYPILFRRPAVRAVLRRLRGKDAPSALPSGTGNEMNPMSDAELERDAQRWMDGWARQFDIADFEAPLTPENKIGRRIRVNVMRELVDFCTVRGYRPVYVIPPAAKHLAEKFTKRFMEIYVYDFLTAVDRPVPRLDYTANASLTDSSLYFNSFFLNARGRRIFTQTVWNAIR